MRIKNLSMILAVAALALLAFLFKGYQDQSALADAASNSLASSNATIKKLGEQNMVLESQNAGMAENLTSLKKAANAASAEMPARLDSNDVLKDLLALCDKHNVTGIPITSGNWAPLPLQQRTYSVLKMNLKLTGTETHLIECVQEMQSQLYPTLKIDSLALTTGAAGQNSTAVVNLTIYAR